LTIHWLRLTESCAKKTKNGHGNSAWRDAAGREVAVAALAGRHHRSDGAVVVLEGAKPEVAADHFLSAGKWFYYFKS